MMLLDLNYWNVSVYDYGVWCRQNNVDVLRVSMMKYRIKKEDFLFFKLKFDAVEPRKPRGYD
ncbi:MAG TPA: hypothetical protein VIY47_07320 [Ignavibacteriaceae bacterium]